MEEMDGYIDIEDLFDAYRQGELAFWDGKTKYSSPYTGVKEEYWVDGFEDAEAQHKKKIRSRRAPPITSLENIIRQSIKNKGRRKTK